MSEKWKRKSRKLAREMYWDKNDRENYKCPDCGRTEDELLNPLEVHHKDGQPMDNRPENHIALCRPCHNLRENKKPSISEIKNLQTHLKSQTDGLSTEEQQESVTEEPSALSVYLAGSMQEDSTEHDTWRASIMEPDDFAPGLVLGSHPARVNSPTEVSGSHGSGVVEDIASSDMAHLDESDAILAYFNKKNQVGTLTELVYAVTSGMPALVLFDSTLLNKDASSGVELHHESPVYWFLINFLTTEDWNGLGSDIDVRVIDSRDEIKDAFIDWDWMESVFIDAMTPDEPEPPSEYFQPR